MSSHSLTIPDRKLLQNAYDFRTKPLPPVHLSFFSHKDIILALWESGYYEVIDLRTRLGPGKAKIMDPETKFTAASEEGWVYKQAIPFSANDDETSFALLQSNDDKDRMTLVTLVKATESKVHVDLPGLNGRLIKSQNHVAWQSPTGEIVSGKHLSVFTL